MMRTLVEANGGGPEQSYIASTNWFLLLIAIVVLRKQLPLENLERKQLSDGKRAYLLDDHHPVLGWYSCIEQGRYHIKRLLLCNSQAYPG